MANIRSVEHLFDLENPNLMKVAVSKVPAIIESIMRELPNRARPEFSVTFPTLEDARRWVALRSMDS